MPIMYKKGQGKYGHYDCGKGQARRKKQIEEEELDRKWEKAFRRTKDGR